MTSISGWFPLATEFVFDPAGACAEALADTQCGCAGASLLARLRHTPLERVIIPWGSAISLAPSPLVCAIIGAAFFPAMDWLASFGLYPGYHYTSQHVSELTAIGAPLRHFRMRWDLPRCHSPSLLGSGVQALEDRPGAAGLFALTSLIWAGART